MGISESSAEKENRNFKLGKFSMGEKEKGARPDGFVFLPPHHCKPLAQEDLDLWSPGWMEDKTNWKEVCDGKE